jgi:membrane-bound ClpP family serine protease
MHLMIIIMLLPIAGIIFFFLLPFREALICYVATLAFSAFFYRLMFRSMKKTRPVTGEEAMIGGIVEVLTWQDDSGTVFYQGATWEARSESRSQIKPGAKVKITAVEGLTVVVSPLPPNP